VAKALGTADSALPKKYVSTKVLVPTVKLVDLELSDVAKAGLVTEVSSPYVTSVASNAVGCPVSAESKNME
jgi:hypothetical protein